MAAERGGTTPPLSRAGRRGLCRRELRQQVISGRSLHHHPDGADRTDHRRAQHDSGDAAQPQRPSDRGHGDRSSNRARDQGRGAALLRRLHGLRSGSYEVPSRRLPFGPWHRSWPRNGLLPGPRGRGEYFSRDLGGSYIVTQSVALDDPTSAVAFSCWYDASILLGPAGADGRPTVLNDKAISVRQKQALYFDGAEWQVGEAATVQDLGDGNQCPAADAGPAGSSTTTGI